MKKRKTPSRIRRLIKDLSIHTPFSTMLILLVFLWLAFSAGIYFAEHNIEGSQVNTYGKALYWGVAAFSTAGIADTPASELGRLVGGIWIVLGSMLFFGTIVATVTTYFMRPMQGPHKKIIDTIEYNLEQLNDLSLDELDLLKETVDTLIIHVEELKEKHTKK